MSDDLTKIADRITQCMKEKGLKQVDIVKTTGVSKGSVSKWLSGKAKPSGESLLRLSQVLNKSEYWLLNGEYPYNSYEDIDDAMDSLNAMEESYRDRYIKELDLDPNLPYSIRFLQEQFENKLFDGFEKSDYELEPLENEEDARVKEFIEWQEREYDADKNENTYKLISNYSTIEAFIDNCKFSKESIKSQREIAGLADASLEKTLFYMQEDHSMEPTITVGAQCSIDLTKRKIINGKLYLVKRNDFFGIRVLFNQSDGSLLLQCKNSDYPNEKIPKTDLDSLKVIGYVYAWTNINPW